jgi:hypothetical protein
MTSVTIVGLTRRRHRARPRIVAAFTTGVLLAGVLASPARATEPSAVVVDGLLRAGDDPLAAVVDAHVVVRDPLGSELFVDDQLSIDVDEDGRFTFALELGPVLHELLDGAVFVEVGVVPAGSGAVPVVARAHLGASFRASQATTASTATTTATATALRAAAGPSLSASALVSAAALASPGGPTVAWPNLANRPAGVDDGDDGNVASIGSGLVLSGTTLSVGTVGGASIVDGTVDGRAIASSTFSTTHVAGLTAADFADAGLVAADFAGRSFVAADVAGNRASVFRQPAACALPGALTTSTTCPSVGCATAGQVRRCSDGVCVNGTSVACSTISVGQLLFAP